MRGLEFFVFALVDVTARQAYPLAVQQTMRSAAEKAESKARQKKRTKRTKRAKKAKSKPRGRPPGSRNKDKQELNLAPELVRSNELLTALLKLIRVFVRVKYLALEGHFGHHQAVLRARANDLHLISKLRKDATRYEKYAGPSCGKGPPKKYGARLV